MLTPLRLFEYIVAIGGGFFCVAVLFLLAYGVYGALVKWVNAPVKVLPSETSDSVPVSGVVVPIR